MKNIKLLAVVNAMLAELPEGTRKAVYKGMKWAGFVAVLALVVVLNDNMLGFNTPENVEKIVTAVVAFFASMGLIGGGSTAEANLPSNKGDIEA